MTTLLDTLKQAREALNLIVGASADVRAFNMRIEAITNLTTVIEQLKKAEPAAWRYVDCSDEGTCCYSYNGIGQGEPLYLHPAETNELCTCTSTHTYTNGVCDTCGGVDSVVSVASNARAHAGLCPGASSEKE